MRTVTHNTFYLTGASIIQKALSFIYFTLLARTFSADQIGAYSYSLAFTTIFSIAIDGGLTPVLIRYTARKPQQARSLLVKILKTKVLLLIITAILMLIAVSTIDAAFSTRDLILAAAIVMIADSFNLSAYGALRGYQNLTYESVGMIAAQAVSLIIVIVAVITHAPIVVAIIGLGVGSLVNSCIALFGLSRFHDASSAASHDVTPATLAREAAPFALAGIFARGYSYLDLLLLGSFTTFAIAGTYSIANKLTFVFQFIPLALSAALYPAFAQMIAASEKKEMRALWQSSERYLLLSAGFIVLTLISLRTEILGFFGPEHTTATTALTLLAISLMFSFISYPVGALLNASGLQKLQTTAMAITLVCNAALNFVLIRPFGAEGAAASALAGNIILFSVGAWFATRRVIDLPWRGLLKTAATIAGAGGVAGAGIYFLRTLISVSSHAGAMRQLIIIGGLAASGAIMYFCALLLLGAISRADIQELTVRLKRRV